MTFLALAALETTMDQRITESINTYPRWLCHRGCDGCCRRLARLPELTAAEWEQLSQGIATLPPEVRAEVSMKICAAVENSADTDGFIVCPLLDEAKGECRVYAYRPIVCRAFGFYVGRDGNRWCGDIQALYETGALNNVVFGNYDAVQRQLEQQGGASQSLFAWFTGDSIVSGEPV